jgi:O-antigen ligase
MLRTLQTVEGTPTNGLPAPERRRTGFSLATLLAVPIAILVSRRTQRALLGLLVLNLSWQVQKHFFLREDAADLGSLGGLQVSLTNIALALLYAAWLVRLALEPRRRVWRGANQVILPALGFLLACVFSLYAATDLSLGVFEVVNVLERLLLAVYIAKALSSVEDVRFLLRVLLIGLVTQSLLMLAQVAGFVGTIDLYGLKARAEFAGDSRVSGTLGSPNPAAAYLAMTMAIALSILLSGARRSDRRLALAGLLTAIVPMIATLSRGGWLSLVFSSTLLIAFAGARVSKKAVAACLLAIALLAIPFAGTIRERLFGDDNGSAASRMPLNQLALTMAKDHPLLGVGANNFPVAMTPDIAHSGADFLYAVHNTYLLVLVETGVGGLAAFLWLLAAILDQARKAWRLQNPLLAFPALGCAAAVAGFMLQINFEPVRGGGAGHLLWLIAGLVTLLNRLSLDQQAVPSRDRSQAAYEVV